MAWMLPVRADASVLPPGNFKKDATVRPSHGRPRGHRPTVRYRPRDNPGYSQELCVFLRQRLSTQQRYKDKPYTRYI
jgi:hypothetical protein